MPLRNAFFWSEKQEEALNTFRWPIPLDIHGDPGNLGELRRLLRGSLGDEKVNSTTNHPLILLPDTGDRGFRHCLRQHLTGKKSTSCYT
jgi:hypothetical protein